MSLLQSNRMQSLVRFLLWITLALLITAAWPAEVVSETGEDEDYVLKFNGNDSYVRVEDDGTLSITGNLTVEALVYWDGTPGYQVIASKPDTANQLGWAFGIRDGQPEFHAIRAFTEQKDIDFWEKLTHEFTRKASFTLEPNTWNHLAIVVENGRPTYDGLIRFFHNGELARMLGTANGLFLQSENTPLLIGRKFESDSGSGFSGYIDYVRLWDTNIYFDTVKNWYNRTDLTGHPNLPNLVAYWDFSEGEGSFISDISGNGHTGQLMNGAEWVLKDDVFRTGALESTLSAARKSLSDYPQGVNIGQTPKSARSALQTAIDTAQDIYDNHGGVTQEAIDLATDALADALDAFLATVITPETIVEFSGGDGSEENPYLIQTPEQLHQIRGDLSAHYQLLNDIDLAGWSWEPIGSASRPFTGGLDGNGKIIRNLTISLPDEQNVGLFGVISTNGATSYVRNLGLEDVDILGETGVGALAGDVVNKLNGSIKISNIYVSGGTVEADIFTAGGLFGSYGNHPDYELVTQDVYVRDVLIEASSNAGGLLGNYGGGHLSRAFVIGTVKPTNDPNYGRSAGPIYSGSIVWEHQFKMSELYWNVTCDGCDLSHNYFSEELTLEQLKERASFGDLWDFGATWLLFDDDEMLPVLQAFHPLTELEVSLARDSVQEAGYFFPEEKAQIEVTATYDSFDSYELTGTDDVTYEFNDVVNVTSEGVITALRPGEAEIDVRVGTTVETIELTVHQILPDPPHGLKVPTTAVQGGTELSLTWKSPEKWGIGAEQEYVVAFFDGTKWSSEFATTESELTLILPADLNTANAKFRVRTETTRGSSEYIESAVFMVDSVPPSIEFVVNGNPEWSNVASTSVKVEDNLSGVHVEQLRYLWSLDPDRPGDEADWALLRSEETLTQRTDGRWYLHIIAEDHAGHTTYARSAKFLVDGTPPAVPTVEVGEHDLTEWITTSPVVVNITPGDDEGGSGVKDTLYRTRLGEGFWSEWMSVEDERVLVEADGITHLEAKTVDAAHNESLTTSIQIRLDGQLPKGPYITLSTDVWTDRSVNVWMTPSHTPASGLEMLEWTTDETAETWTMYDPMDSIVIDTEGETTIYARAISGAGTIGEVSSAVVKIDRGIPTIETDIITLGDGEDYVIGSWTNQDVQISIVIENEFSDISFQDVNINGQSYYDEAPIVLTQEGKYAVQIIAMNEVYGMTYTDSINIFIDKSKPGSPVITTDTSDWTNEPVTVSVEHGAMTGLSTLSGTEVKIGQDGDWTTYEEPFLINEDGEHYIYARTWNEAGSATPEEEWAVDVVRIASERPAITLETITADGRIYEPNTWTNQAVTVTANVYADTDVPLNVEYSINSENHWKEYTEAVTVEANGNHTVRFRAEDAAGNMETADLVLRIDQVKPTVMLGPNGNDGSELEVSTEVVINDAQSGVKDESFYYLWSLDSKPITFGPEWKNAVNGDSLTKRWQAGEWYLHIYAKDAAGNETYFTSDVFLLHDLPPPKLDLTSKAMSGGKYEPKTWAREGVSIEVDVFTESGEPVNVEYSLDSGQAWSQYDDGFVIHAAGVYTVIVRAEDAAGNIETEELIVKIDDEVPEVSLQPNGNATSQLEVSTIVEIEDTLSGVEADSLHYLWSANATPPAFETEWQKFSNGDALELREQEGEWYLHIYAIDVAGNEVIFTSKKFLLHMPSPPDEGDDPAPGDGDGSGDPGDEDEGDDPAPGNGDGSGDPGDEDEDADPTPGDGDGSGDPGDEDEGADPTPGDGDGSGDPGDEDEGADPAPGNGDGSGDPGDEDEGDDPAPGDGDGSDDPGDEDEGGDPAPGDGDGSGDPGDEDEGGDPAPGDGDGNGDPGEDKKEAVPGRPGNGLGGGSPVSEDDEDSVPGSDDQSGGDPGAEDEGQAEDPAPGKGDESGGDGDDPVNGEDNDEDSVSSDPDDPVPGDSGDSSDPVDGEEVEPEPRKQFSDVTGHWAASAIRRATDLAIVNGYPDGTFRPDNSITRAEFTVMLVNLLGLEETEITSMTFSDQDQIGTWAAESINLAVQAGIVSGYEDGRFRPSAHITRQEMAVMIARALQLETDEDVQTAFNDDEAIAHWAKGAVEAIRELGIVTGRGDNRFAPKETATRAEAATMLLRLMQEL